VDDVLEFDIVFSFSFLLLSFFFGVGLNDGRRTCAGERWVLKRAKGEGVFKGETGRARR
jgi:hypothetical protein